MVYQKIFSSKYFLKMFKNEMKMIRQKCFDS